MGYVNPPAASAVGGFLVRSLLTKLYARAKCASLREHVCTFEMTDAHGVSRAYEVYRPPRDHCCLRIFGTQPTRKVVVGLRAGQHSQTCAHTWRVT